MRVSEKYLVIFLMVYFFIQFVITKNHMIGPDQGTHLSVSLFYKELVKNLINFHSINDVIKFGINYIIKYPKISFYYPPLYHIFLMMVFLIKTDLMVARVLNISLTMITAFVIYKLSYEFFENEKISFISSIFFLSFGIIFRYADKVMIDISQILFFSLVIWYYLKLRKKNFNKLKLKNIFLLSILLSLSFLTKFYSIFLPIILLIDSLSKNRIFFSKILISILISLIIISPYIFFYINFNLYKITFGKSMEELKLTQKMYFDPFYNFGQLKYENFEQFDFLNLETYGKLETYKSIFIPFSFFVAFSIVYSGIYYLYKLYRNRKDILFLLWFIIPLIILIYLRNVDPRFAFILMPIYSMSCGFTLVNLEKWLTSDSKKNVFVIFIIMILILQLIYNFLINYQETLYPIDEMMKLTKGEGNILILSDSPVYSSVYIFYGIINNVQGNIIRPCTLDKHNISKDFLKEWGVKYIIDQENNLTENMVKKMDLKNIWSQEVDEHVLRLLETEIDVKPYNCNYICVLGNMVCENQTLSEIKELINKNVYITKLLHES